MIDPKKVKLFASRVFYMAEDAIKKEKLQRHEIAAVLRKLADYQEELPYIDLFTREELGRCQK